MNALDSNLVYRILLLLAYVNFPGHCQGVKNSNFGAVNQGLRITPSEGQKATLAALQKMIIKGEASTLAWAKRAAPKDPTKFVADRTILSDLCMGADQEEHDQIAEGVIICLLVATHDSSEIPLRKVYVEFKDGRTIELPLLATLSPWATKSLKTNGIIGRNIWVGLYWAPKARSIHGDLVVDFSSKRKRFNPQVAFPLPKSLGKGLEDKHPKDLLINFSVIKEVIEREYPGMDLAPSLLEEINRLNHQKLP